MTPRVSPCLERQERAHIESAAHCEQLLNIGYDVLYEIRSDEVVVWSRPSSAQSMRGSQYYIDMIGPVSTWGTKKLIHADVSTTMVSAALTMTPDEFDSSLSN